MTHYEPGTVAEIGWLDSGGRERAIFDGVRWNAESGVTVLVPTGIRPLVVLDLDASERSAREVVRDLRDHADMTGPRYTLRWLADEIEAQTRPPKPPEPTGLGAVVEDREHKLWMLDGLHMNDRPWWTPASRATYAEIEVVKVLSEGVPT